MLLILIHLDVRKLHSLLPLHLGLEWADLSILSENAAFNDVVHVPSSGTELSITTTGDCRLHPEGTEVKFLLSII